MTLIAEVKTRSPFGYKSKHTWDKLFEVAEAYGDIISIHTDPLWGGSFELLAKARNLTRKPILAKGIHSTDTDVIRAIDYGADLVLVVGRMPQIFQDRCLIEPKNLGQLKMLSFHQSVVWNSRDLKNGKPKKQNFDQARKIFPGWLCQASNIRTVADVDPTANAILVGEHLLSYVKSLKSYKPKPHEHIIKVDLCDIASTTKKG